jgi:GDP-mannose transporter
VLSSLIGGVNDLNFSLSGYSWMTLNCACAASYGLYMRKVIKQMDFKDFDSVYYNNIIATPILLVLSILSENWTEFIRE